MLADVGGRENLFGDAHAVVFDKDHAELSADAPVVVYAVGNRVDELDDALGAAVARGGLGAKDKGAGRRIVVGVVKQAVVKVHDVQDVQKLALVFVQALYLDVKNAVRVKEVVLRVLEEVG